MIWMALFERKPGKGKEKGAFEKTCKDAETEKAGFMEEVKRRLKDIRVREENARARKAEAEKTNTADGYFSNEVIYYERRRFEMKRIEEAVKNGNVNYFDELYQKALMPNNDHYNDSLFLEFLKRAIRVTSNSSFEGERIEIIEESEREIKAEIDRRKTFEKNNKFSFDMTPRKLYMLLSKSVIGQEEAKQKLANAVCYHYQNIANNGHGRRSTYKNNILLVGPTGCGKTYLVQKVSQIINVPLLISDATRFSATGYVGKQVDSLIHDLVLKADRDLSSASRGIIYLDEIDKIAAQEARVRDVGGKDVQSGLLKIVEGGSEIKVVLPTGERMVKTDDILFIGGGAFSDLYKVLRNASVAGVHKKKESDDGALLYAIETPQLLEALQRYGMIPELIGRIPVVARLRNLTQEELRKILTESDESVIKQYEKDFASYGIKVEFDDSAYTAIAEKAYQRNVGARGLGAVVEESLTHLKFYLPETGVREVKITSGTIENPLETTLQLIQNHKRLEGGK